MANLAKPTATVVFRAAYWRVRVTGIHVPANAKVLHLGLFEVVVVRSDAASGNVTLTCRSLHQLGGILDEDHSMLAERRRFSPTVIELTDGEVTRVRRRIKVPHQRTWRLPHQRSASRAEVVSQ